MTECPPPARNMVSSLSSSCVRGIYCAKYYGGRNGCCMYRIGIRYPAKPVVYKAVLWHIFVATAGYPDPASFLTFYPVS